MQQSIPDSAGYYLDEFDSARFWARVNFHGGFPYLSDPLARVEPSSGECWTWTGKNTGSAHPYGQFLIFGESAQAHDIGYKEFGGKIALGKQIDHLCRNTLCIRHNHLEPVTPAENTARGVRGLAQRTHCVHGHEFTEANTVWRDRSSYRSRECRQCRNAERRRRRSSSKNSAE